MKIEGQALKYYPDNGPAGVFRPTYADAPALCCVAPIARTKNSFAVGAADGTIMLMAAPSSGAALGTPTGVTLGAPGGPAVEHVLSLSPSWFVSAAGNTLWHWRLDKPWAEHKEAELVTGLERGPSGELIVLHESGARQTY